jgi:hypothetical protein
MGGFGSGRWGDHIPATTVEECRAVDLGELVRGRDPAPGASGVLRWFRGDEEVASIGFELVAAVSGGLAVRFRYTWTAGSAAPLPVTLDVELERAVIPRGGWRWWGRCPLACDGVACRRRVKKLYFAPGSPYLGCRPCHRLAYTSSREHDRRVDALLRDPRALGRLVANRGRASITQLGLALKALTVLQTRDDRWFRRFERRRDKRRRAEG